MTLISGYTSSERHTAALSCSKASRSSFFTAAEPHRRYSPTTWGYRQRKDVFQQPQARTVGLGLDVWIRVTVAVLAWEGGTIHTHLHWLPSHRCNNCPKCPWARTNSSAQQFSQDRRLQSVLKASLSPKVKSWLGV